MKGNTHPVYCSKSLMKTFFEPLMTTDKLKIPSIRDGTMGGKHEYLTCLSHYSSQPVRVTPHVPGDDLA